MVENAFNTHVVHGLDNPEEADFSMAENIPKVLAELKAFGPVDVVMAASKGTYYLLELWRQLGLASSKALHGWKGVAVMINANPTLKGKSLPRDVGGGIVIAHGAADNTYKWTRAELEELIATVGPDKALLYLSEVDEDNKTRPKSDGHDMVSLLKNDLILRLVDAAATGRPEDALHMSWLQFLSPGRLAAEQALGAYKPSNITEKWATDGKKRGSHLVPLVRRHFTLPCGGPSPSSQPLVRSCPLLPQLAHCDTLCGILQDPELDEFEHVSRIFLAEPAVTPHYYKGMCDSWGQSWKIISIERVENKGIEGKARGFSSATRFAHVACSRV